MENMQHTITEHLSPIRNETHVIVRMTCHTSITVLSELVQSKALDQSIACGPGRRRSFVSKVRRFNAVMS